MTIVPDSNAPVASSSSSEPARPAATAKYHRSPTLIRAQSSQFATPLSPFWRFVGWTLALWTPALFYIGPLLLALPPILYTVASPTIALLVLAMDLVLMFYPHRPWPWFRRIYQLWYPLFDLHHNLLVPPNNPSAPVPISEDLANRLCIWTMHPHGVIPIQAFLWMAFADQYVPSLYGFGATTDAALRLPLLRQVLLWASVRSAQRHVLRHGLEHDKQSLFLFPGGVAEIFLAQPGTHRIQISRRRGLMKLALQTGAALVPIYVFGGNDFYHQLQGGLGFLEHVSRSAKAGLTLFWGQYGLPMPFPVQCSMVLGDPIFPVLEDASTSIKGGKKDDNIKNPETRQTTDDHSPNTTCPKIENPTDEQVEELMQRYMDAMRRLFDQYKDQAGYPNAQLEIR